MKKKKVPKKAKSFCIKTPKEIFKLNPVQELEIKKSSLLERLAEAKNPILGGEIII